MSIRKIIFITIVALSTMRGFSQEKENGSYIYYFTEGNQLLEEKNYPRALKMFLKAYAKDSSSANINFKVGYCYLKSANEKSKAMYYLEKASKNVTRNYDEYQPTLKKAPETAYQYLGEAYHLNYKFEEALTSYEKYKSIAGSKNEEALKDIMRDIEITNNAKEIIKTPVNMTIENLGDSINTIFPDYGPVVSADESSLIFTSRRTGSTGGLKTDNDEFFEDIFISYKKADKTWSQAKQIPGNINSYDHEATIGVSVDGQQLFIYKDNNGGDIYTSKLEGDVWAYPTPLDANINTPSWETHVTMTADGNTFYFISDRKEGSFGGKDIWRVTKLPNGKWSLPFNMGPIVNTKYDEDAVFIHPDGVTLFFASKGHYTMGGYDIFTSTLTENGWTAPKNIGYPINTTDDDLFFFLTVDGRRAYYASNKSGGKGDNDIYLIKLDTSTVEPVAVLKGLVTYDGASTNPNGTSAEIIVTDLATNQTQNAIANSKTGKFLLILNTGHNYSFEYAAQGYDNIKEDLSIDQSWAYRDYDKEVNLKMISFEAKRLGTIAIKGTVKNTFGEVIPEAKITVNDNTTGKVINTYTTSADSGSYFLVVSRGQNINISYEGEGYLFQSENINVPKEPTYSVLQKDVILEYAKKGARIRLNNIFFDSGKSTLRKESHAELDNVYDIMIKYPDFNFEIAGHTDNKGSAAINTKLSQDRANAVAKYLQQKGIDKVRLVPKGYGPTVPVAPNTLSNGKPDPKGMQLNRRVELKIME